MHAPSKKNRRRRAGWGKGTEGEEEPARMEREGAGCAGRGRWSQEDAREKWSYTERSMAGWNFHDETPIIFIFPLLHSLSRSLTHSLSLSLSLSRCLDTIRTFLSPESPRALTILFLSRTWSPWWPVNASSVNTSVLPFLRASLDGRVVKRTGDRYARPRVCVCMCVLRLSRSLERTVNRSACLRRRRRTTSCQTKRGPKEKGTHTHTHLGALVRARVSQSVTLSLSLTVFACSLSPHAERSRGWCFRFSLSLSSSLPLRLARSCADKKTVFSVPLSSRHVTNTSRHNWSEVLAAARYWSDTVRHITSRRRRRGCRCRNRQRFRCVAGGASSSSPPLSLSLPPSKSSFFRTSLPQPRRFSSPIAPSLALLLARVLLSSITTARAAPTRHRRRRRPLTSPLLTSLRSLANRWPSPRPAAAYRASQPGVESSTRSSSSLLLLPPLDAAFVLGESRFVARAQAVSVSQHGNGVSLRPYITHTCAVRAHTHLYARVNAHTEVHIRTDTHAYARSTERRQAARRDRTMVGSEGWTGRSGRSGSGLNLLSCKHEQVRKCDS